MQHLRLLGNVFSTISSLTFASHGVLEGGKPFDAAFMLCDDNHLTLLDIVRSRLPAAELPCSLPATLQS
jgi:hypothetical protein